MESSTRVEIVTLPTLCLNMIVKNESKIITRLFDSVSSIIDCYCICDTGSTDNTVELITNYFKERNIPGKIVTEPFINFAHNRNVSLQHCKDMSDYVLLMDADMVLQVNNFNKEMLLDSDSFYILQGNDHFFYHNMRIVRNNGLYSYFGVTHEYINTPPNNKNAKFKKNQLFISDIGDGGAKSDKFERDIALLIKGIEDDPKCERYHFYLANTYFDSGKNNEAIDMYKKRIEMGGWEQEIWYSYYRLGLIYKRMNNVSEAIYQWLLGYECFPDRVENLYEILQHYRVIGKCKTALIYYTLARNILNKKLDWSNYLFLHSDIYTYKIEYEFSVIACYIGVHNVNSQVVTVFNNTDDTNISNNVLSNMKFYKDILKSDKKINIGISMHYLLNDEHIHFNSSSSCIIHNKNKDGYIMNMRLVNYNIDEKGFYHDCDKHIITVNKYLELDSNFKIITEKIIDVDYVDRRYVGIEDIRINMNSTNEDLQFIGTGYHKNNTIGIVVGKYEPFLQNNSLKPIEIKPSFANTECEKNWVYVNNSNQEIVYGWYPLKLCTIDVSSQLLNIIRTVNTPKIFKYIRGSTNGFFYKNEYWFIGHIVSYEQPRHYYHIFSVFDENMNILRYSAPFKFTSTCIEYCLGLIVEDDRVLCTFSEWDRTTVIGIYNKTYIDSLVCYTV
uniref:Glycosyltransferase 2-like domain-containing protein n=1 Tax=viral metagenome TaxID=1070528 RepID=A0A6C0B1S9_9ZZZZ